MSLRVIATNIIRTFVAKGSTDAAQRLEILRVLDIVDLVREHETSTRDSENSEILPLRLAMGSLLQVYSSTLITLSEDVGDTSEPH